VTGIAVQPPEQHTCPSCKAPLDPDQEECPICTKVLHTPPSTWTLFRLWRFAVPYRGQLAARLPADAGQYRRAHDSALPDDAADGQCPDPVPERPEDRHVAGVPVHGRPARFGRAGLGAGLGPTYVLALVSERMGADMRSETYEHLLRLSLEFFGGKRTGDLMSRIGSGSDRICVFLSLHLLDFLSDVLMIIMTGVILFD
jgi:ATP-binding cassette subfamily B protein